MNMSARPSIGPYHLLEELGRGERTVVYKAWQSSVGRPVALKILRRYDPDGLEKFQAEGRLSANLNSPGVRDIYEAGQTPEGYTYVAMEYVEWSLKDLLQDRLASGKTFSRPEVAHLLTPIAGALDDIHGEGLVHLDIKPANILVSKEGNAVLADFGIAHRRGEQTCEGTPLYLSPEQASGNRPVGPWSDIYSLGVLIYEMTAGRPPFLSDLDLVLVRQHLQDEPPSPRQFNPQLDSDLEQTLLVALSKDPRRRPPTASALLRRVSQQRPEPTAASGSANSRLPRKLIVIAAVLIVLIPLLLIVFGMVFGQPNAAPTQSIEPTSTPIGLTTTPRSIAVTPLAQPGTPASLQSEDRVAAVGAPVVINWRVESKRGQAFFTSVRHSEKGNNCFSFSES